MRAAKILIASIALAGGATAAMAGKPYYYDGYVVAHSDFGKGSVSGPVRLTAKGPQVRLPGGTWVYCRQSCSETLRVETVDFWESQKGGKRLGDATSDVSIFGRPLRREWGW